MPLDLQGCGTHHENPSGPVAQNEFQDGHTRFNRLAQANIVGNQQIHPGHVHGADHRVELVILDVNPGAEGRLDIPHVSGRGRTPADGIEKGIQPVWRIEAGWRRQGDLFVHCQPRARSPR